MRFLPLFIFFLSLPALAQNACESESAFEPLREGLSPLWAQELVGGDLIIPPPEARKVPVGSLDLSFAGYSMILKGHLSPKLRIKPPSINSIYSTHGGAAASLLGSGSIGITKLAEFRVLHFGLLEADLIEGLAWVQEEGVEVVNISAGISSLEVTRRMDELTGEGLIFVTSAGNSAPRKPWLDPAKESLRAIVVGSVDLDGSVSAFSQEGENVALYGPGAESIVLALAVPHSLDLAKGKETDLPPEPMGFGMTSAATPIVAGALVNVKSLLPNLRYEEARRLLVRTGTPLPGENRKVMVNAYRAFRVAERLAQHIDWRRALEHESIYDFSEEARSLAKGEEDPCPASKLQRLRRAFLLDPTKARASAMAKEYEAQGLPGNAAFFRAYSH